jgi:polysaccharide export outer membrane protein
MRWLTVPTLAGLIWLTGQAVTATQPPIQISEQQPSQQIPSMANEVLSLQSDLYILGAGDRVYIDVFGVADYSREYEILVDGTLNLPLVGTVPVAGMTLDQAAEVLQLRYSRYIRRPVVTLGLQQPRAMQVAIAGEVNRPGSYALSSYTLSVTQQTEQRDTNIEEKPLTLTQAIQAAGGITQAANIRKIQVYRPNPAHPNPDEFIEVDLWRLLQEGDLSQDIALRDGDSILVPKATELNHAEATVLATANFSPASINVYVVGEVGEPGLVQVPPNTPLNQALLAAGGFNHRASRSSVRLVRLNLDGTVSEREISVDFEHGVNEESNPALRNNDSVIVRRSGLTAFTDVLGAVLTPFSPIFNFIRILGD